MILITDKRSWRINGTLLHALSDISLHLLSPLLWLIAIPITGYLMIQKQDEYRICQQFNTLFGLSEIDRDTLRLHILL